MPFKENKNEKLNYEISERKRAEEELEQRNKLLNTLLNVSNLVSSAMEPKPLLEAILKQLKTIIEYNGAKVFTVQGDHVKLFVHRSNLTVEEEKVYNVPVNLAPLGVQLALNREPVVINDLLSDEPLAVSFRQSMLNHMDTIFKDIRSWMGLPMMVKDRIIGVLTLGHSQAGYYKAHHIELGMAFANQAALEFENARLYSETNKKADELRTMLAVQQAITSRLDLDSVLKLIADESLRLTNSVSTAVFLVEGYDLVFSVYSGDDYSKMMGLRVPIDKSMLGRHLMEGRSVIFRSGPGDSDVQPGIMPEAGPGTYLIVPLLAGKKPVGIISAKSKETDEFDHEDERILNMFASSAVIGIENARMYQDEKRRHMEDQQRRHVAEGLRDILAVLNSNRNLDEILDFIVCEAARLMGTDSGALFRLQKDRNVLTLEACCGMPEEFMSYTDIPVGTGAVGKTVAEKKPIVVSDIPALVKRLKQTSGVDPLLELLEDRCNGILAVPLLSKDEVYGCIALYFNKNEDNTEKTRTFSIEEVGLAVAFADQAALAIDNARLKAKAEEIAVSAERSRLARDLHDAVTQTLFSASLIAEVLPKIWERNPEDGRRRLEELRQLTRGALAEMRTLLLELRPTTLVEAALEELLRQLAEATTGRARVPVALKLEGHIALPTEVKIAFYRIAQEALNNIAKHSGASRATVAFAVSETGGRKKVGLEISDDGKGFDPQTVTGEHLGLGIMQERAEAIGACLEVRSKIGRGTDIAIYWDCD